VAKVKVWKKWDIQPWRVQTFKFFTDPELEAKEWPNESGRELSPQTERPVAGLVGMEKRPDWHAQ
jgi:hypothetical protein